MASLQNLIISFETSMPAFVSYTYAILSALSFTTLNLFVKKLSHLTPYQILYYRLVTQTIITYFFMVKTGLIFHYNSSKTTRLLFSRGFVGILASTFAFISLVYTSMSESVVIQQLFPVYVGVLSAIILKEKYDFFQFMAALLCLIGLALILKPSFLFGTSEFVDSNRMVGIVTAILAGFSNAVLQIVVKTVGAKTNMGIMTIYLGVFSGIFNAILTLFVERLPSVSLKDIPSIMATGIFGFIGQMLMNRGLMLGNATRVSIMSYVSILYAYLLEYLILDIAADLLSMLGSFLIFCCLFVYLYQSYHDEKKK